jgi:hypothetical protein
MTAAKVRLAMAEETKVADFMQKTGYYPAKRSTNAKWSFLESGS